MLSIWTCQYLVYQDVSGLESPQKATLTMHTFKGREMTQTVLTVNLGWDSRCKTAQPHLNPFQLGPEVGFSMFFQFFSTVFLMSTGTSSGYFNGANLGWVVGSCLTTLINGPGGISFPLPPPPRTWMRSSILSLLECIYGLHVGEVPGDEAKKT